MKESVLYEAWKRLRDAEINHEHASRITQKAYVELEGARDTLHGLLAQRFGLVTKCSACAGKKDGKKCRAHANRHPQWKK